MSLIARGPHLAAIRANGLRLRIDGREHVAHLPATEDPSELGVQDYVLIALKAHDIPAVVDRLVPLLGPHTTVVTASNGLPYWFFRGAVPYAGTALDSVDPRACQLQAFGDGRALGCVVFPAAELVAPGVVRHDHGRRFPIGEPDGKRSERLVALHQMMQAGGLEAPMRDDIRDEIWLKLAGNVCFNPISALTCATIDIITTDAGTRALCATMMAEARAVGERLGLRIRVDAQRRLEGARALGPHKMSMLQDLERGRSMEIESIVGVVSDLGRVTGIATPAVDVVLSLIRVRARTATESLH